VFQGLRVVVGRAERPIGLGHLLQECGQGGQKRLVVVHEEELKPFGGFFRHG